MENLPARHIKRNVSNYNYRGGQSHAGTATDLDSRGNTLVNLEGWLEKQGHLRKNWKRRFFVKTTRVIKKNNFSGVEVLQDILEYYTDENQTTKKGETVLSGATLVAASDKTCMFAIEEPSTTQRLGSVYVIRAGSEEEREQWVRALGTFMLDVPNWLRVRTSAQILDDAVEASLGDCTSALMALNPGIRRTTVEAALRAHKGDVNAASQSIKKHNPELVNLGRQATLAKSGRRLLLLSMMQMDSGHMAADVYDEAVNEATGHGYLTEGADVDFQHEFISIKDGAYLVYDNEGQGSLQLIWSQGGRPEGAIAFFSPSASIAPKDRVSRELVNGVKGLSSRQVRTFFRGVAEFISAAYLCGGRLAFFEGIELEVAIYLMEDYNVTQLKPSSVMEVPGGHTLTDQFRIIAHADIVAVVHPQCGDFRVPRMMPETFFARGHRAGAAIRF
mmetsp:Transcript_23986/g.55178  ORF Transcript_23986/g.55178 Transcript_23986/m.55178 type:complete len:446 (+) Transcript_23986:239-1576(+)